MKRTIVIIACLSVFFFSSFVSAEIIRNIDIDFVTIGNAGNPGDMSATANPTGCGAVDYEYRIGKYEITNSQWDAFVSAAGAPTGNNYEGWNPYDEDVYWTGDNIPANEVSWLEVAQFCNYLTSGDKSKGAYQFSGDDFNPGDFLDVDRDSAISVYGTAYVIPTEDEWYKAAYYKPDNSGYSLYSNGLDTVPAADEGWNYDGGSYDTPWDVGTGTIEQNGTFDMMGNIYELVETPVFGPRPGIRGASYWHYNGLSSAEQRWHDLPLESYVVGFRIAAIPEPATMLLLGLGGLMLRRKKA